VTSPATQQLHEALSVTHLRTGEWFHHLLVTRLRAYEAKHPPEQLTVAAEPVGAAGRIIRKTAVRAAKLGTGVAGITTVAGVLTAEMHTPLAMLGDLATRTWIMIEMSCEVAALFGVRFDPDDPTDVARLYALALGAISPPEQSDARGHELLARIEPLHSEDLSASIGSILGNETLVRSMVPGLGLFTSGRCSYRLTCQIGKASMRYARGRRALDDAVIKVEQAAPGTRDLLIEGIWFVFTADAKLDTYEAALLAHLVHSRPEDVRRELLGRMLDDEAGWLERLAQSPEQARGAIMRALETAAALDTKLRDAESNLLAAASQRLRTETNRDAVAALADRFGKSGVATPPPATVH
jgi:hypothetical protein